MISKTRSIEVDGRHIAYTDEGSGPVVVLLHAGLPGPKPYAASSQVFAPLTALLVDAYRVIAVDRPGFGGSTASSVDDLTFEHAENAVLAVLQAEGIAECHFVGHGEGGLLALQLARTTELRVLTCAVLAGNEAAPTGDSLHPLRLASPPVPTSSRRSQAWVAERISYTPHHLDELFLDALATHASSAISKRHAELATEGERRLRSDLIGAKDRLFGYARDVGYEVPITLVWGSHDPLSPVEAGVALMDLIAATTSRTLDLRVVNRTGHFVFRERPGEVADILLRTFERELSRL